MEAIYLYVLFEMSAAGQVYKWRVKQPDMKTCIQTLKETKAQFPKTSENELGVVITCGGAIERFYSTAWHRDEKK
jgi:hypothetical protein